MTPKKLPGYITRQLKEIPKKTNEDLLHAVFSEYPSDEVDYTYDMILHNACCKELEKRLQKLGFINKELCDLSHD